jgi:hypothetical protein
MVDPYTQYSFRPRLPRGRIIWSGFEIFYAADGIFLISAFSQGIFRSTIITALTGRGYVSKAQLESTLAARQVNEDGS